MSVELSRALRLKCLRLPSAASASPTEPRCVLDWRRGCSGSCCCCCLWVVRRGGFGSDGLLRGSHWVCLFVSGVCTEYRVEYPQAIICAVKNSSVLIPCSFFFPSTLVVHRVMWGHERNNIFEGPFLFDSDNFLDPKFQYHGDKKSNCSLIIHQISRNDSGKYTFRFVTNDPKGKFTGVDGSMLKVAGKFLLFYSRFMVSTLTSRAFLVC